MKLVGVLVTALFHLLLPLPVIGQNTDEVRQIMLGRCLTFKNSNLAKVHKLHLENLNCTRALNKLLVTSWEDKDPDTITQADYQPFLDETQHKIPINQSLFWSGSNSVKTGEESVGTKLRTDFVHDLADSGNRFFTLEDTLWGYIADGLSFCQKGTCGGEYRRQSSLNNAYSKGVYRGDTVAFWPAASTAFGKQASGEVHFIGSARKRSSGEISEIYRLPNETAKTPGSIFATVELQALNVSAISQFSVWIIPRDFAPQERCGSGSVKEMEKAIKERFGSKDVWRCSDDAEQVYHLLCVDNVDSNECQRCIKELTQTKQAKQQEEVYSESKVKEMNQQSLYIGVGIGVGAGFGFTLFVLAVYCACKRIRLRHSLSLNMRYNPEEMMSSSSSGPPGSQIELK